MVEDRGGGTQPVFRAMDLTCLYAKWPTRFPPDAARAGDRQTNHPQLRCQPPMRLADPVVEFIDEPDGSVHPSTVDVRVGEPFRWLFTVVRQRGRGVTMARALGTGDVQGGEPFRWLRGFTVVRQRGRASRFRRCVRA
jgi:hypothetical protein